MEKIIFEQLQEELYYEKLANGLDVYILPKTEFNKSYATFTTNYGSVDNHFKSLEKKEFVQVPDGIAHFLEHKLFEKEDGDVFQQFSKQGASANAFTSFTRTSYLFSSTSNFEQNLTTLIDFVQDPYFSDKTVEKEKGIIGQEINMYDDNPDWRLYFGTISNMYHQYPVKIDIAGTIESIAPITKDMLYECYHTFYHPSNMLLFIVGPVDAETIMEQIRQNQNSKKYEPQVEIERKFEAETETVAKKKSTIQMNVQTPKVMVGIKAVNVQQSGNELLKRELATNIYLEMLFGKSSVIHENLYTKGYIDQSFSYDYTQEQGFGFALIGGDSTKFEELSEQLFEILEQSKSGSGLSEVSFRSTVKKKIGSFLRSLNSPEYIANQFTRYQFNKMNLFDVLVQLEKLTFADIQQTAKDLIDNERMTVFQVLPSKKA